MGKPSTLTLSDEERQTENIACDTRTESLEDTATATETQEWWVKRYLWEEVDPDQSTIPLSAYCFMTGFFDSVAVVSVTSNTIQLAMVLAQLFTPTKSPSDLNFSRADYLQYLTSLGSFLMGAFFGRIGDHVGARTRAWLCSGTMLQSFFTMIAAILLRKNYNPDISNHRDFWSTTQGYAALGFTSGSMGLQGIMGKRLNTPFSTTIVLTTIWCELMAEPMLFCGRFVKIRDVKIAAITALFTGAVVATAIYDKAGPSVAFAIGTSFRVVIAFLWLMVPSKDEAGKIVC